MKRKRTCAYLRAVGPSQEDADNSTTFILLRLETWQYLTGIDLLSPNQCDRLVTPSLSEILKSKSDHYHNKTTVTQ